MHYVNKLKAALFMNKDTKQKLSDIIEKEVGIRFLDLDQNTEIREQVSLDSIQFIQIITRIEKELCIELPISIMEVSTLNEFLSIVEKELQNT